MTAIDVAVVALCLAAMIAAAWLFSAREKTSGDFFTAGKSLGWPRACASMLASEISALALLSLVASTYAADWSGFRLFFAAFAARLCLVWLYLPIVYPAAGTTVYGYLDARFGPVTRRAGGGIFIGMRLLASGARLAAAAAIIAAMLGAPPAFVIVALAAICAAYTSRGGLRAVSAAGTVQIIVIAAAPISVLFFLRRHLDPAAALTAARAAGRLAMARPVSELSLAPAFFAALATFGADQDLAQNFIGAATLKGACRGSAVAAAASVLIAILYLAVGTALWTFYRLKPEMTLPDGPSVAYAHFCLTSLPPLFRGLAAAAVVMAAVHQPLCSLASVFVEDFYRPWLSPRRSEAHYLRMSRAAVWFAAAALSALALLWSYSEPWLSFLLRIGAMLLGPLLGVFLFALFSRRWADRANAAAMAAAAGAGAIAVALIEAGRLDLDSTWLLVSGSLLTAFLARQLAPRMDADQ